MPRALAPGAGVGTFHRTLIFAVFSASGVVPGLETAKFESSLPSSAEHRAEALTPTRSTPHTKLHEVQSEKAGCDMRRAPHSAGMIVLLLPLKVTPIVQS